MVRNKLDPISIKIPAGLVDLMDKDIEESQEFRNRSEYLVAALRDFIKERQKTQAMLAKNEDFIASSGSLQSDQNIKTK